MIDEWAGNRLANSSDSSERSGQDRTGVLRGDVATREHERTDLRRLQRGTLDLAIPNALVAGQDDPAVLARLGQPDFVGHASRKTLGVPNDVRACVSQCRHHREAVERLVEKVGKRFRRP